MICFYTDILVKESKTKELFVRQDYKEMTELGLMLLGGKLPDDRSLRLLEYIVRKCLLSVNKKLFEGIVFQQR